MQHIDLQILDQEVRVTTEAEDVAAAVLASFSAFEYNANGLSADRIEYLVTKSRRASVIVIEAPGLTEVCSSLSDLIYTLDKSFTLMLQRRRADLFFVHAAAVAYKGACLMIAGASGAGKSTFCWELCNAGFEYISDELAPIDLRSMLVSPYPRALCLKREIESMPAVPATTLRTERTIHFPAESLPVEVVSHSIPVGGIVFLEKTDSKDDSVLELIGAAEGAARLYANGLNQLAHEHDGLEAVKRIASAVPCYKLMRGNLQHMRAIVLNEVTLSGSGH